MEVWRIMGVLEFREGGKFFCDKGDQLLLDIVTVEVD